MEMLKYQSLEETFLLLEVCEEVCQSARDRIVVVKEMMLLSSENLTRLQAGKCASLLSEPRIPVSLQLWWEANLAQTLMDDRVRRI